MGNVLSYCTRSSAPRKSFAWARERPALQPPPQAPVATQALHRAVRDSDLPSLFELLDEGADPNAPDENGYTPLLTCLLCASSTSEAAGEIVRLLINYKCNVNAHEVRNQRRSALHVACTKGLDRVAEQLLMAGADPDYADRRGRTALYMALWKLSWHRERFADSAYLRIALRLLRYSDASVVSRDKEGVTPLLLTVVTKNLVLLRIVLARGAGCLQPDDIAGALLAMAHVGKCQAARRLLIEAQSRQCAQLTLRERCRTVLRHHLLPADGSGEGVEALPLPLSLKRFLLLQDTSIERAAG